MQCPVFDLKEVEKIGEIGYVLSEIPPLMYLIEEWDFKIKCLALYISKKEDDLWVGFQLDFFYDEGYSSAQIFLEEVLKLDLGLKSISRSIEEPNTVIIKMAAK